MLIQISTPIPNKTRLAELNFEQSKLQISRGNARVIEREWSSRRKRQPRWETGLHGCRQPRRVGRAGVAPNSHYVVCDSRITFGQAGRPPEPPHRCCARLLPSGWPRLLPRVGFHRAVSFIPPTDLPPPPRIIYFQLFYIILSGVLLLFSIVSSSLFLHCAV